MAGKSLMRSLGEFVGHIVKGVRTPVARGDTERIEVRRDVQEQQVKDPRGTLTLRRTTIEEIEIKGDEPR